MLALSVERSDGSCACTVWWFAQGALVELLLSAGEVALLLIDADRFERVIRHGVCKRERMGESE